MVLAKEIIQAYSSKLLSSAVTKEQAKALFHIMLTKRHWDVESFVREFTKARAQEFKTYAEQCLPLASKKGRYLMQTCSTPFHAQKILGFYEVSYKHYYTPLLRGSLENDLLVAKKVLAVTPGLLRRLDALSQTSKQWIAFKIPFDLERFFFALDILVVYSADKALLNDIDALVKEVLYAAGITLEQRGMRAQTAFDFLHTEIQSNTKSHTEMIATILASEFLKGHPDTPEQLTGWIIGHLERLNALDEKQIFLAILSK